MKKIILLVALILGSTGMYAQNHSDFDIIASEDKNEIIYKGQCTFEDIEKVPAFQLSQKAAAYQPDNTVLKVLQTDLRNYQLIIFLGTWCEDSHYLVPQLYKVLQASGYPSDMLTLYAADRSKKTKNHEEATFAITNVPTIILMQNGQERGRITETVKKSIEQDLLDIIRKK